MEDLNKIIYYSFFSGITVFLGALLSYIFEVYFKNGYLKDEIIHTLVAFGGGIIISTVALVLVPSSIEKMNILSIIITFILGAIAFYYLDNLIKKNGKDFSQLLAMLMDFIPEAIALGAIFAYDEKAGLLLAIFIGLQNFPESFNSYIDLRKSGFTVKVSLFIFFLLSFIGVISAVIGTLFLSDKPELTAYLMLFSSGGILYLIFQDIAPLSKIKNSGFPALGANFGFLLGIIGEKLIG